MRKLDVSSITDTSEFPVKQGTLQFLQDSYAEIVGAMVTALLSPGYNPGTVYVLFGCTNSGTAPFYNITAGALFYQGEIFIVPATSFTATGSNVGVFQIVTSQFTTNADPVTFTDMTVRNVHNIRQIQVVQGASGSGIADYSAASYCNFVIPKQLNLTCSGQANLSGVYPNLNVDVPNSTNLHPCLGGGSVHVGDVSGGGVAGNTIAVVFGSAGQAPVLSPGQQYYVQGTIISQGIPQTDAQVQWNVIDSSRTNTGFSFHFAELVGGTQAIQFEYLLFAK